MKDYYCTHYKSHVTECSDMFQSIDNIYLVRSTHCKECKLLNDKVKSLYENDKVFINMNRLYSLDEMIDRFIPEESIFDRYRKCKRHWILPACVRLYRYVQIEKEKEIMRKRMRGSII